MVCQWQPLESVPFFVFLREQRKRDLTGLLAL